MTKKPTARTRRPQKFMTHKDVKDELIDGIERALGNSRYAAWGDIDPREVIAETINVWREQNLPIGE